MNDCVATIGTFDGFHLGHRNLIEQLILLADSRGLGTRVITFDNHPLEVIRPNHSPNLILSRQSTIEILKSQQVDDVSVMNFTKELQKLKAADFMRLLRDNFNVKVLMMGYSNTLGSDRLSTHEEYINAGTEAGIEVIFARQFIENKTGMVPSSSLLRKLLIDGDVSNFATLTGYDYHLSGSVVRGLQNGRKIGFPTFNIDYNKSLQLPAIGVYKGFVTVKGIETYAVISVGTNPTIADNNKISIEAHAINADYGDCYGEAITITIADKIRDQRKFNSLEELRQAIKEDINAAN